MTKPGIDIDGVAETEADHFGNCPVCGALIDMRDLGQLLARVHDAEIEISEGPEPLPREGPVRRAAKHPAEDQPKRCPHMSAIGQTPFEPAS
jgi:hypothetical protein